MNAYLSKPFRMRELEHMLSRYLAAFASTDHSEASDRPTLRNTEGSIVDLGVIANLRNMGQRGRKDIAGGAIRLYLKHSPRMLDTIIDALRTQDTAAVIAAAHKWKSSSSIVGAAQLAQLLQQIEDGAANGSLKSGKLLEVDLTTQYEAVREALTFALNNEDVRTPLLLAGNT